MTDLLKARFVKYFRSPLLYIAAIVSLTTGIHGGEYCTYFKDEVGTAINCPTDDMWMLTAIWAAIILVSMCCGREFSDGTIRNKIAVGHTKARIILAEVIVASIITLIMFLLNIVPTAIGGWYFISAIPLFSAVKWFVTIFLTFEVMSIFAVMVTYLFAKRAVGVVVAFVLHFAFYIMVGFTEGYYYNINEPRVSTGAYYIVHDDGSIEEKEQQFENGYYIEGFPKILVQIEHAVNPMYGLVDAARFGYITDQKLVDDATIKEGKHRSQLLNFNIFKMLVYCIAVTGIGAYLFHKKDLK